MLLQRPKQLDEIHVYIHPMDAYLGGKVSGLRHAAFSAGI